MKIPKFVQPEEVKRSLQQVSLYLTAWETLRSSIMERVKGFYTENWTIDEGKLRGKAGPEYKAKVIALHPKDELHACTLWLKENGALTEEDVDGINMVRRHRNSIGHEIRDYIAGSDHEVDRDALMSIYGVVKKLDIWWLCEVELPCQEDVDQEDYEAARRGEAWGGYSALLELILPIFDGDFEQLESLHEAFKKRAWVQP